MNLGRAIGPGTDYAPYKRESTATPQTKNSLQLVRDDDWADSFSAANLRIAVGDTELTCCARDGEWGILEKPRLDLTPPRLVSQRKAAADLLSLHCGDEASGLAGALAGSWPRHGALAPAPAAFLLGRLLIKYSKLPNELT